MKHAIGLLFFIFLFLGTSLAQKQIETSSPNREISTPEYQVKRLHSWGASILFTEGDIPQENFFSVIVGDTITKEVFKRKGWRGFEKNFTSLIPKTIVFQNDTLGTFLLEDGDYFRVAIKYFDGITFFHVTAWNTGTMIEDMLFGVLVASAPNKEKQIGLTHLSASHRSIGLEYFGKSNLSKASLGFRATEKEFYKTLKQN